MTRNPSPGSGALAPPTNKPRLSTLDLDRVALDVTQAVAVHVRSLHGLLAQAGAAKKGAQRRDDAAHKLGPIAIAPTLDWEAYGVDPQGKEPKGIDAEARKKASDELLRKTSVYEVVQRLGHYAITGEPTAEAVRDMLAVLVPLHASVLGEVPTVETLEAEEPTTALGLLICAARAREKLAANELLTPQEVGALVELDPVQVRTLAHAGEIPGAEQREDERRRPWYFAPKPIKKWLRGRGVTGL